MRVAIVAGLALAAKPAAAALAADAQGAILFKQRCAVCHMPDGQGVPGAFPPLKKDVASFAGKPDGRRYLILVVTRGLAGPIKADGQVYRSIMPPLSMLTDAQVASILNHVTGTDKPFTEAEVTKIKTAGATMTPTQIADLNHKLVGP